MVITYSDEILRGFVAQMCLDIGWNASHTTSLDVLTQMTSSYLKQLSKLCVNYANHCGRQSPTFDDIYLAFRHFNIDLSELKDYVNNVESTPLSISVPKFPVKNVSNRVITNTGEDEERPECYYEWMPPLRESRTVTSTEDTGECSKANEDQTQEALSSTSTSAQPLAQESETISPKRTATTVDGIPLLRDLFPSVGQREGRLPDSQRIKESDESRDNSPERVDKIEVKVKVEEKDKKFKKKDKEKVKEEKKKRKNKENSVGIKAIISKNKEKKKEKKLKVKKFLKIKDLKIDKSKDKVYSPLSIKVTGLSTGTLTATSTPTMTRSPASLTLTPDGEKKSKNASFDVSIEAVIARACADSEDKNTSVEEPQIPKKRSKLTKKEDSIEKKSKRIKKDNSTQDKEMYDTIDEVVRQSNTGLLSPKDKQSPRHQHQQQNHPIIKLEPVSIASPNPKQSQTNQLFDDDEAAKTLVLMASDKTVPKRKKNKPSATITSSTPLNENSSAFQSAMSSFPKVSPGVSPLSPTMFSMTNQTLFPTPPLFGQKSPPIQTSPHDSHPPPPPLTKPKTLAEKKALPPEIMHLPIVKKEKDKENIKKDREKVRDRDRDKDKDKDRDKPQKPRHKNISNRIKSKKTVSDDDSSSDDNKKPKINIKLGSTATAKPLLPSTDTKHSIKTLTSPKHVSIPEDLSLKPKKRGPKKKFTKEEVKEDKSCTVIRETITVNTADGDSKVWICPACKQPDDGSPMIGCDTCEDWYHYSCVGIKQEPNEDESWFCKKCVLKQQQIESKFVKKKETKKRVKDK